MTKKDYILIAEALIYVKNRIKTQHYDSSETLSDVVSTLASELSNENEKFDTARFINYIYNSS